MQQPNWRDFYCYLKWLYTCLTTCKKHSNKNLCNSSYSKPIYKQMSAFGSLFVSLWIYCIFANWAFSQLKGKSFQNVCRYEELLWLRNSLSHAFTLMTKVYKYVHSLLQHGHLSDRIYLNITYRVMQAIVFALSWLNLNYVLEKSGFSFVSKAAERMNTFFRKLFER